MTWDDGLPEPDEIVGDDAIAYERATLVDVLVYHYRKDASSCGCWWSELGRSHPEHVASVYEARVLGNR